MGMFDYVKCEYPLPDPELQTEEFQTKDFDCVMDAYIITSEGRLLLQPSQWVDISGQPLNDPGPPTDIDHHGYLRFYTSRNGPHGRLWYEYSARFTDGQLVSIERIQEKAQ